MYGGEIRRTAYVSPRGLKGEEIPTSSETAHLLRADDAVLQSHFNQL